MGRSAGRTCHPLVPTDLEAARAALHWTAVADSELGVVVEMARCLRLIRERRVPG